MKRMLMSVLGATMLAGCQRYAPQPLNTQQHMREWAARSTDADALRQLAEAIGRSPARWPEADAAAAGLTLQQAEILTLAYNPDLRSARARARVALAAAEQAGHWDDPSLSFDVLRVTESIPDPWVIGGVVGFTIPLSGRLPVEKSLASADHQLALARVAAEEWDAIVTLRLIWAEWSASMHEADLLQQLLQRIDEIVLLVDRLEAAQSLNRLEGRLFRMEQASRRAELVVLEARVAQGELALKAMMGLIPEAAVTLAPEVMANPPAGLIDGASDVEAAMILESRCMALAVKRAEYAVAEEALHLEVRKQYPDLQIGPAYEWDEGQNKIGLGAGLPLPVLNGNRRGIAEARATREAARAEYEASLEVELSALRMAQRECEATQAARTTIERDLLPLAEAQIADERRIAELGELNVLVTLESVVRAHEIQTRLIRARMLEAQARHRLARTLGPQPQAQALEDES